MFGRIVSGDRVLIRILSLEDGLGRGFVFWGWGIGGFYEDDRVGFWV